MLLRLLLGGWSDAEEESKRRVISPVIPTTPKGPARSCDFTLHVCVCVCFVGGGCGGGGGDGRCLHSAGWSCTVKALSKPHQC